MTFNLKNISVQGEHLALAGVDYILIRRDAFEALFEPSLMRAIEPIQEPVKPRAPKSTNGKQRTPAASNGHQPPAAGDQPPMASTFANCIRIALKATQPARIGDILDDLTASEIPADRGKIAVCLSQLKKQGEAHKDELGRWRLFDGTTL